ncbi:NAD-dependent epimerase/dehydratase family protein [Sphingomonas flavalba]|uniref:NAD-dependent epimerase/dehydratase family protein n=1 Tax=Sphingomonas flavalba TaxID=2559804 RepID=UPI001EF0FF6C|nr:NAD(P)H-binding protein [Sphingomonas flavalba]
MKPPRPTLAITGGTGFVGSTLIRHAARRGHPVSALTRRPQEALKGVNWIDGALDRPDSLKRLVEGADAVIHVAGVVNARDRAGFAAGNAEGTLAMVEATKAAGVRRFVHVSSLAAREPELSDYGWSKARAEQIVAASGLDWTAVRPPAVYGPGDLELLELFRMAKRRLILLPPPGRISVIEVSDLSRLLLSLVPESEETLTRVFEADDGRPGGWSHAEFAEAIAAAVGRRAAAVHAPPGLLRLAARADRLIRRGRAKLTPDRAAYFCHPDWVIDPAQRPPVAIWQPHIATLIGLKATANAYRAARLL